MLRDLYQLADRGSACTVTKRDAVADCDPRNADVMRGLVRQRHRSTDDERLRDEERRTAVATFFVAEPLVVGGTVTLSDEAAHHIRVARVAVGDCVALRDGAGRAAVGKLVKVSKHSA